MTVMKTLTAQDAPRIKIFLQEAPNNLIGEKIPPLLSRSTTQWTLPGDAQNPSRPPARIQHSCLSKKNCQSEKKSYRGSTLLWRTRRQAPSQIGISHLTVANKSPYQKGKRTGAAQSIGSISRRSGLLSWTKNHYQTITNAYTPWYDRWQEISQNSNSTYFFCYPWEVDFELPSGAPETQLDGFLNETWLPGSTCNSASAQDPFEQFLPNLCNNHWYSSKINKISSPWYYLVTTCWILSCFCTYTTSISHRKTKTIAMYHCYLQGNWQMYIQ